MEEDNKKVLQNFKNASNSLALFFKQANDTTIKTYHLGRNDAYRELVELCQKKQSHKPEINTLELIDFLNEKIAEAEAALSEMPKDGYMNE